MPFQDPRFWSMDPVRTDSEMGPDSSPVRNKQTKNVLEQQIIFPPTLQDCPGSSGRCRTAPCGDCGADLFSPAHCLRRRGCGRSLLLFHRVSQLAVICMPKALRLVAGRQFVFFFPPHSVHHPVWASSQRSQKSENFIIFVPNLAFLCFFRSTFFFSLPGLRFAPAKG